MSRSWNGARTQFCGMSLLNLCAYHYTKYTASQYDKISPAQTPKVIKIGRRMIELKLNVCFLITNQLSEMPAVYLAFLHVDNVNDNNK